MSKTKWNPNTFDPYLLDTDVWLSSASSFGAKYAAMVCDHFMGFSTFPTSAHNYSVKYSQWQNGTGNVIEDFRKSAYKYNNRPALIILSMKIGITIYVILIIQTQQQFTTITTTIRR